MALMPLTDRVNSDILAKAHLAGGDRMHFYQLRRREFITLLGGAAATWPVTVRAQQTTVPMVAFVSGGSPDQVDRAAFQSGLGEPGYVDGKNVTVEFRSLVGQYESAPSLMADLVRRGVTVIATPGSTPATLAAKAATTTIPIVFAVAGDPVKLGLVESFPRPGGNATGISFLSLKVRSKRLELLHELAPKAVRIAVLITRQLAVSTPCRKAWSRVHAHSACRSRNSQPAPATRSRRRSRTGARTGRCPFC